MDSQASSFQLRSLHFVLEAARIGRTLPLDFVDGLVDVDPAVAKSFQKALGDVQEGRLRQAKERLIKAFWESKKAQLCYPEDASCFINPPVSFTVGQHVVTLKTRPDCETIGPVLAYHTRPTPLEVSLCLNSLQGPEVGFVNQVIVFCDGNLTNEAAAWVATTLKAHLLPGVTSLTFEFPHVRSCPWLKLTQEQPDQDIDMLLGAFADQQCLFEYIRSCEDESGLGTVEVIFGLTSVGS